MSANSPTLGPSHENLQEDAASPIIASEIPAEDTTATAPESQQASRPSHAPTETTAVEGNPVTTADATVTTATIAPTDTAAAAAVVYTPLKDMKTASSPIEPTVASLSITLLLISGVRHQFVMDEAYLTRHSVKTGKEALKDPFEMSVWQLKECIWKDWKEEWDQRPASAMFIRLIHFGRMLEDKHPLKDCRLNQDTPNVVHMTVRPPEVGDDEMTQRSAKGFGHNRENGNSSSSPSCRCVIL